MTRTPEQEKQWQAAREKILECGELFVLAYQCRVDSLIDSDIFRLFVDDFADAILALPGIEVRDKEQSWESLRVNGCPDVIDISSLVKVLPK